MNLLFILFLIIAFPIQPSNFAGNKCLSEKIRIIYDSLQCKNLELTVFEKGYRGYLYLKSKQKLKNENMLTIVDYNKSEFEKRLFIINLKERKMLFNVQVAQAKNTGTIHPKQFSNIPGSGKNSLGFYVTGRTYWNKSLYSLKLFGIENGYNNNAFIRGIVFHGANNLFNARSNTISKGCVVIDNKLCYEIIEIIKEGSCLFIYYPDKNYLTNSIYQKTILNKEEQTTIH